jgi:hypothetical protein
MPPRFLLINLSPRHVRRLLLAIIGTNLLLLAGTAVALKLYRSLDQLSPTAQVFTRYGFSQLNLAAENVLAAWYASMLLLAVAAAALLCYFTDRTQATTRSERRLSLGWLAFTGIFVLLSFDELAAMHERLGALPALNPFGDRALGWVALLAIPIGAVGLFMLWFAWATLKRRPISAWLIAVGAALFLSIPVQEHFEVRLILGDGPGLGQRPILGALLEEGAEVFGSTCFLAAMLLNVAAAANRPRSPDAQPRTGVIVPYSPRHATLIGAGVAVVLGGALLATAPLSPWRVKHDKNALWTAMYFHAAARHHDIDLATAFLAEDVVLRIKPVPAESSGEYTGREALRGWLDENRRAGFAFDYRSMHPSGQEVTWRGHAQSSDWPGPVEVHVTARLSGGKVRELGYNFDPPLVEVDVPPENWMASATAGLAALLLGLASQTRRRMGELAAGRWLALFSLMLLGLSAWYGANLYAYTNWGGYELVRRLTVEGLKAGLALVAVAVWLRRVPIGPAAFAAALLIGAGISLGSAYAAPASFLGCSILIIAQLPYLGAERTSDRHLRSAELPARLAVASPPASLRQT